MYAIGRIVVIGLAVLVVASTPTLAGPIEEQYQELGGPNGPLGLTVTPEFVNPDGTGRRQHFVGGHIYWSPMTGTACHPERSLLGTLGRPGVRRTGPLGYPGTGEFVNPDGTGRRQHFVGGHIYWSPMTGAHAILNGPFWERWAAQGWETGPLGYPVSEEQQDFERGSSIQPFTGGFLYWTPTTGVLLDLELFKWTYNGRIDGMHCIRVHEPSDDHAKWSDNYLCSPLDLGVQWSYSGAILGMRCTQVSEPHEPFDTKWADNFLCVPRSSPLHFAWFHDGLPDWGASGAIPCVRVLEPSEGGNIWLDNYLCYSDQRLLTQ